MRLAPLLPKKGVVTRRDCPHSFNSPLCNCLLSQVDLDKDDPHHLTWIMNRAEERAAKYGIKGESEQQPQLNL